MIDDETARKLLAELIASGQPADADRRDLVAVPHGAPVATTEISAESAGTVGEPQAEAADGASDPEAPLPEGDAGMREANERIANQVSALARVEPKQIAQVIRDWMTEKE
ncbi:MAG TPA: hypothetical protein GX702_05700 [Chloroflexi bacterium]|nr:hypothetical protein [Chloroflexota bacterium]